VLLKSTLAKTNHMGAFKTKL